jgi:hypothetical protein
MGSKGYRSWDLAETAGNIPIHYLAKLLLDSQKICLFSSITCAEISARCRMWLQVRDERFAVSCSRTGRRVRFYKSQMNDYLLYLLSVFLSNKSPTSGQKQDYVRSFDAVTVARKKDGVVESCDTQRRCHYLFCGARSIQQTPWLRSCSVPKRHIERVFSGL